MNGLKRQYLKESISMKLRMNHQTDPIPCAVRVLAAFLGLLPSKDLWRAI